MVLDTEHHQDGLLEPYTPRARDAHALSNTCPSPSMQLEAVQLGPEESVTACLLLSITPRWHQWQAAPLSPFLELWAVCRSLQPVHCTARTERETGTFSMPSTPTLARPGWENAAEISISCQSEAPAAADNWPHSEGAPRSHSTVSTWVWLMLHPHPLLL